MITLTINHVHGDIYSYTFSAASGGVMSGFTGTIPKDTVEMMTAPYHKAATTSGVSIKDFKVAGVMIFSQFPDQVQQYLQMHPTEPLLIQTNDSTVPWELFHDPDDFQVLSRPIGRRIILPVIVDARPKIIGNRNKPSVLIIANPGRDNPGLDLPSADEEGAALLAFFQQSGCMVNMLAGRQATRWEVIGHLQGANGAYDIIHYAGHATLMNAAGKLHSSLVLADGALSSEEIRRNFRGSPLVFLNACHTIAPGQAAAGELDRSTYAMGSQNALDLALAFNLGNNFGKVRALVGTLFRNNDTRSREMAQCFYQQLMAEKTIGESLRIARQQIISPTDVTWASYILYGDPDIRLREQEEMISATDGGTGAGGGAGDSGAPPPDAGGKGDTEASGASEGSAPPDDPEAESALIALDKLGNSGIQAIFNAMQETGGSMCKMLSTPNLFLGMLTVEGGYTYNFLRNQVKDPEPIVKLFRKFREGLSESIEDVGVSERAKAILRLALDYAGLDGDDPVKIEEKHLLQAFFEDGGGITAEVLSDLGVTLPPADRAAILALPLFRKKVPNDIESKSLFEHLGESGRMAVDVAFRTARHLGHQALTTPHLFIGVLQVDRGGMRGAIRRMGVEPRQLEQLLCELLPPGQLPPGAKIGLTERFFRILELALTMADPIEARQLGIAILKEGEADPKSITIKTLRHLGIDPAALPGMLEGGEGRQGLAPVGPRPGRMEKTEKSVLETIGKDLTRLAREGRLGPVLDRELEMDGICEILLRKAKACPVLVGEAGVGKTAIVEGFARRVAEGRVPAALQGIRVIEIATNDLLAGTKYRGEFEERMRSLLREVTEAGDIVLFLDEIHTLIGAGGSREGAMDAGDILKPALARGDIRCIGATTHDEYRRWIENDSALERRFSPVPIPEPSMDSAVRILTGLVPSYAAHHRVIIPSATIEAAVRLACERLPHRRLPDKAIDLLDQACARVQRLQPRQEGVEALPEVTVHHLEEVVALRTGVPLTGGDKAFGGGGKLEALGAALGRRIIGQDAAIATLVEAFGLAESGIREAGRPLAVLLFMGPVGVGKSSLARAFAEESGRTLIQLDMNEYMERHQVAKLIGSPPGYIGSEREGYLVGALRSHPYSLVLLDEMEKAHPEVRQLFLGLFAEGRMTDARGRIVEARQALFVMTTNLGGGAKAAGRIGFTAAAGSSGQDPRGILHQSFSRELVDRIDRIVSFRSLMRPEIEAIARKLLDEVWARLAKQHGVLVEEAPGVAELLGDLGYAPDAGVRPLKRVIEEQIVQPISRLFLEDQREGKKGLVVQASDGRITLQLAAEGEGAEV